MASVKLSVTLPDDDVDFIEEYQRRHRFDSRSAVLHKAVSLLRSAGLGPEYEEAFARWDEDGAP